MLSKGVSYILKQENNQFIDIDYYSWNVPYDSEDDTLESENVLPSLIQINPYLESNQWIDDEEIRKIVEEDYVPDISDVYINPYDINLSMGTVSKPKRTAFILPYLIRPQQNK